MPSTRYRHPGDVIRLIGSGLVLTGMLAALAVAPGRLTGPGAATVTWLGSDPAGRLLTGLAQVAFVVAAAGAAAGGHLVPDGRQASARGHGRCRA